MTRNSVLTLVSVIVVAVTAAPVAGLGHAPTAAPASPATPAEVGVSPTEQQEDRACNYTRLYNRTIDSVVLIRTDSGLGSGFVFDIPNTTADSAANDSGTAGPTSYVVTNQHVVNESATVEVQFTRGESRTGQVVGATAFADLAVVRVNDTPSYVEALPLATERPRVGERVAAIGSPFGLKRTMTSGIVSGVERLTRTQTGLLPNTVQTDAPINPGNSGGPLVSCEDGTVVGVNRAGGAENIGFAVSASLVERIVPELIEDGEFAYPFLGIRPASVTQAIAQANDLNTTEGVYVVDAMEGTPASAVLQGANGTEVVNGQRVPVGGDVIVGIGNRSVESSEDLLSYLLTQTRPGDTVELTVLRDGERQNVTVQVVERPNPQESA